jgi:hypothetical protein
MWKFTSFDGLVWRTPKQMNLVAAVAQWTISTGLGEADIKEIINIH